MTTTAEDILKQVRALPERERLRLVERIVHEMAERTPTAATRMTPLDIWGDVDDDEFESFMESIRGHRSEPWRSIG